MRRPLIMTGGPAVGKTTCGRALAEEMTRAAYIDVDDIVQLVVAGAEAPWRGEEGLAQHVLGALNASALARNFVAAGFAVTVADLLKSTTTPTYRDALPNCLIVHLRISIGSARKRAATRRMFLTDDEFELLHRRDRSDPPAADVVLHVDGMTIEEQLDHLRRIWKENSMDSTPVD